jgi:hypothetical protein
MTTAGLFYSNRGLMTGLDGSGRSGPYYCAILGLIEFDAVLVVAEFALNRGADRKLVCVRFGRRVRLAEQPGMYGIRWWRRKRTRAIGSPFCLKRRRAIMWMQ